MTGFIDFSSAHEMRIERVRYEIDVLGRSLQELGDNVQKIAFRLYQNYEFRIVGMDVTLEKYDEEKPVYRARAWTELP